MSGGYAGNLDPADATSDSRAIKFIVNAILNQRATCTIVQVVSCSPVRGPATFGAPLGTVSVKPLVMQTDGLGNAVAHGVVPNIPYLWVQGGLSAVQMDPVVGDIGIAVFCDRDISAVRASKLQGPPATNRRSDWADGIYLGGLGGLNATATQFVRFLSDGGVPSGITITSPGNVTINGVIITPTGEVRGPAAIIAGYGGADQVGLQTHTHKQDPDSHGDTEADTKAPTAGT